MSDKLEVSLHTTNDKVGFSASSRENTELAIDYFPPFGDGAGYTSLELLMISLGSCLSTALLGILRNRLKKTITSIDVKANGTVREEHPRALSHIQLELTLVSPDAVEEDVKKAIASAEEALCPVWAMLKGNVEISVSYTIN